MNNNNNQQNKYELTLTNYNLYEKADINGNTYYLVVDNNKTKEEGNGYFCFTLKKESPYYPGDVFKSLQELYQRGYKENQDSSCVELHLEILEFTNKTGREVKRILKAEWARDLDILV